jgi:hypothetical protein
LIPPAELLPDLPRIELNEADTARAAQGRDLALHHSADRIRLVDTRGRLVAIAARTAGNLYHPGVVLVTESRSDSAAKAGVQPNSGDSALLKTMLVLC